MIEASIDALDLQQFERIIVVCLKEHVEEYINLETYRGALETLYGQSFEFVLLDKPTRSQSETVYEALKRTVVVGGFFIKDCDNTFKYTFNGGNEIATLSLNDVGLVDAKNKSYVTLDDFDFITNIVEKDVINNIFCCGGYGFESAARFKSEYENLSKNIDSELYVSHIIYSLLLSGEKFKSYRASNYTDWGTIKEYRDFCQEHSTIFCDLDGVLFQNGSKFGKNGWAVEIIKENIQALIEFMQDGKITLVITTSRPETEREKVLNALSKYGIHPKHALFGLSHSKRILINDFANSNPYPSAISINIPRNSIKLSDLLKSYKQ